VTPIPTDTTRKGCRKGRRLWMLIGLAIFRFTFVKGESWRIYLI
jgi:hypothetical protein